MKSEILNPRLRSRSLQKRRNCQDFKFVTKFKFEFCSWNKQPNAIRGKFSLMVLLRMVFYGPLTTAYSFSVIRSRIFLPQLHLLSDRHQCPRLYHWFRNRHLQRWKGVSFNTIAVKAHLSGEGW